MIKLTDEQKVGLSVAYETAGGNPATVDGKPVWASSNEEVLKLEVSEDGFSAVAVSGALGSAQVTVTADADLGEGTREVLAIGDFEVVAAEAALAKITAGTPETK